MAQKVEPFFLLGYNLKRGRTMQTFNYHIHTKRCGHATGEDKEYVEAAIKAGFKEIAFTEHMGYKGWDDPNERIFYKDLQKYINDIDLLKEEYADRIKIYTGFEFENFFDQQDHIKSMKAKVDFLICGQHAMNFTMYYEHGSDDDDIDVYADQIIAALDSGLTKYVAHIDYFMLGVENFSKRNAIAVSRICDAVLRNDAYIEINLKGMKYGKKDYHGSMQYIYPHYDVFKIVAEKGCKVVLGYDAHYPGSLTDRDKENKILDEFADLGLNMQNECKLFK